jgi:hypothetical protein
MSFLSLSHNFTSSNPLTRLQPALDLKPRARRQRRQREQRVPGKLRNQFGTIAIEASRVSPATSALAA